MLALVANPLGTGDTITDSALTICIVLPEDFRLRTAIYGVLSALTYVEFWGKSGLLTPEETAEYFAEKIHTAFTTIS